MPFNGSGTFSIVNTFVPNTTILSAAVNQNFTDIATGLSDCLTRDGQAGMTAALKAISGSVSAPGISFNSDATAGVFLSATGIVGLVAKSLGLFVDSAILQVSSATVQAGGSGYAVGDTITVTGGTAINFAVLTVATLSGSAVATVTVAYSGNYYGTAPSNPVAQGSTSGVGTGCTLNLTFATQFTRSVVTDESGNLPWQRLGSSSFVSGLMASANALTFAQGIGSTAIATVLGGSFIIPPGGVLSPISSLTAPIPASDATAITRIYWTPFVGNNIPIYNGTNMVQQTTAQIFCDLTAGAQASGGIYDVYGFMNAGVPTLGFSPSWAAGTGGSVTLGACARGTGAGGTAFSVIQGIKVNVVSMTVNNGATTYVIPSGLGTLLGSIYINSTAGQINCHRGYGQSRVWGISNAYNRQNVYLKAGDNTASWTTGTVGFRNANSNAANSLTIFSGFAEEIFDLSYNNTCGAASISSGVVAIANVAVGLNGSVVGKTGTVNFNNQTGATAGISQNGKAEYISPPLLGINTISALEANSGGATNTYNGTETNMLLSAKWRA